MYIKIVSFLPKNTFAHMLFFLKKIFGGGQKCWKIKILFFIPNHVILTKNDFLLAKIEFWKIWISCLSWTPLLQRHENQKKLKFYFSSQIPSFWLKMTFLWLIYDFLNFYQKPIFSQKCLKIIKMMFKSIIEGQKDGYTW